MDEYDDVVLPKEEKNKPMTSETKDDENNQENQTERSRRGRKRGREMKEDEGANMGDESVDVDDEDEKELDQESDEDSVEDDGEREYDSNDSDYGAPRHARAKRRRRGWHNRNLEKHTANHRSPPLPETTAKNGKAAGAQDTEPQTLGPRQSRRERAVQHGQHSDWDNKRYDKQRGPMIPHFEEGYRYPFVVNKWVSIRSFGNFDEFDSKSQKLPAAYGPPMVCQKLASTLWPIGYTSQRLFHDFTGNGAMRKYLCTVRADREHPPALVWRIQALDVETEFVEAQDPAALMVDFRARFAVLKDNPIHNSWLCDAEHFFAIVHRDVVSVVHCLPHHNEVLRLLAPDAPLPELPAVPRPLPKEPFAEDTTTPKPKKIVRRRDSHGGAQTPESPATRPPTVSPDTRTPAKPATARSSGAPASGLTPLQTIQEKAKLEALHAPNAFVWGALAVSPSPQPPVPQPERVSSLLSSQWDSSSHSELERLEDLLGRAEQVIHSLGETNNQLRMLNRIYAQQRLSEQQQQQHPITL